MAGSKINDYGIGDSNIQSVMLTLDKAFKGQHQVSLTNYDNTSASQIAAGSVVENNGALYQFTSNESITGSPSNGTVYIRLVPSGDTITAEYTNTAPTWSDSKQGWYGTGGDANKRYIEIRLLKDSAAWTKEIFNIYTKLGKIPTYIFLSKSASVNISVNETKIPFISEQDNLSEWNNSTYRFTAKNSAYYNIRGKQWPLVSSGTFGGIGYKINGGSIETLSGISGSNYSSYSVDIKLDFGDYVEFFYLISASTVVSFSREYLSIQEVNYI